MSTELPPSTRACVLIYDGECRMCVAAKSRLQRWHEQEGHRILYLPYQSPEARPLLGHLVGQPRPDVAFLVAGDGTVHQGLDAFVELLPHLQKGRFLSKVLRMRPVRFLAYRIYRLLARHRYQWFGAVAPPKST